MSDQKMRTRTGSPSKSRQSVESYQPVWMAHWMRPGTYAEAERRISNACGNEELNCMSRDRVLLNVSDVSLPVKDLRKAETIIFGAVKSLENEMMCRSPKNNCRDTVDKKAFSPGFFRTHEHGKAIDWKTRVQFSSGSSPAVNRASVNGCNSLGEGTSKIPPDWMKTHSSAKEKSFALSKLNHETIAGTSKHMLPHYNFEDYEFHNRKAAVPPLIMAPSDVSDNHLPNCNMIMLDQNHCNQQSHSTDLFCGRKMRSYNSKDTAFRGINASLLSDSPSTSDHNLAIVGHEALPKMQERVVISVPPSQFVASEKARAKKSYYDFYALQKFPANCVQDMETMRICTTVDSVEATPGGFPRFSQTTRSLLITKKTDVNLSTEVFRTTQLITEINQNMPPEIHSLLPCSAHVNRGVQLQPVSSSSHSEEKKNAVDVKTSKVAMRNGSSAETDPMDLEFDKEENSYPGANYTPSTKVNFTCQSNSTQGWKNTSRPDINLELPALPAVESTSEHSCANSSRTQSLEMDILLPHAKRPKCKSTQFLIGSSEPDPIIRWVKRLKLRSSSSSSQEKGSQILAENTSPDRMGRYLKRILNSGIGSSEPTPSMHPVNHSDPFIVSSLKKDKASLLSHAWIKRWLQNGAQAAQKKPETNIVCEPKSSKLTQNDIDYKQLPRVAAMALTGKALNGLRSCELQKRGSFTVWNIQGILETP